MKRFTVKCACGWRLRKTYNKMAAVYARGIHVAALGGSHRPKLRKYKA